MVTFEQIEEANKSLSTMDIKGKDYVVVPQRVKAFRKIYPQGFILTDILSHENGIVVMQTKAGYYDENRNPVVLGSGMAFEKADSSYINKTSYIENCETSSVGRALGFMGFGIDAAICSAEELVNAINNQGERQVSQNASRDQQNKQENGTVTKADKLPAGKQEGAKQAENKPETPAAFLTRNIVEMGQKYKDFNFKSARDQLIKGGVIPDIPSATMTMEQAKQLIDAVKTVYEEAS